MNDFINNNVTVIIRTAGERTERLCHEFIINQIAEENVHIIRETPLTAAVRKSFEIGMRENRKWTFVVDADVLIRLGVIEELIDYVETVDVDVFNIEGKIIDKFLDSPREAGTFLYRTRLLKHAFNLIPDPYMAIRPNSHVRDAMNKHGFTFIKTNIFIGMHDFEQYYRDIYRKCFIQAKKHYKRVLKLLPQWEVKSKTDNDFKVALAGFNSGVKYNGDVSIDINAPFLSLLDEEIKHLCNKEKDALKDYLFSDNEEILLFMKTLLKDISIEKGKMLQGMENIVSMKNNSFNGIHRKLFNKARKYFYQNYRG
jgi:hypothetical protein